MVGKFLSDQTSRSRLKIEFNGAFHFISNILGIHVSQGRFVVSYPVSGNEMCCPRDPRSLETMEKLASIMKEQEEQVRDIQSDSPDSLGKESNTSSVRLFKSCLAW